MTTTDPNAKVIDLENNDCDEDVTPLSGVLTPTYGALLKEMLESEPPKAVKELFENRFTMAKGWQTIPCKRKDCGMNLFNHNTRILDTEFTCVDVIRWTEYMDIMRVGLIDNNFTRGCREYKLVAYCHACNRVIEVAESTSRWTSIYRTINVGTVIMAFDYFAESGDITSMFKISGTTFHLLEHYMKLKPLGKLYSEVKASKAADLCEEVISEANDLEESRKKKRKTNK